MRVKRRRRLNLQREQVMVVRMVLPPRLLALHRHQGQVLSHKRYGNLSIFHNISILLTFCYTFLSLYFS